MLKFNEEDFWISLPFTKTEKPLVGELPIVPPPSRLVKVSCMLGLEVLKRILMPVAQTTHWLIHSPAMPDSQSDFILCKCRLKTTLFSVIMG